MQPDDTVFDDTVFDETCVGRSVTAPPCGAGGVLAILRGGEKDGIAGK